MTIAEIMADEASEVKTLARWIRRDPPDSDDEYYDEEVQQYIMCADAALKKMCQETGRSEDFITEERGLTTVFLALFADEYIERQTHRSQAQYTNSHIMETLLSYSVNILPGEADMVAEML